MMEEFHFRKVGVDDYDDIMSIRSGIYDGLDYLPALYRTIMSNHTGYAALHNGKYVAFECVACIDEGETMVTRALRVSKDYEGKGIVRMLKEYIVQNEEGAANIKHRMYTFSNKRLLKKVEHGKATLVLEKPILFFQGSVAEVSLAIPKEVNSHVSVLDKKDLKEILRSEDESNKIFEQGRIIADWVPYRLLESNVDHFFNEFCFVLGSPSVTGESRWGLLTLGVSYPVEKGFRYNLEVYGEVTEDTLSSHIAEHLRKCTVIGTDSINFVIHFLNKMDAHTVITRAMERFHMVSSNAFHSSIMYCLEEPFMI